MAERHTKDVQHHCILEKCIKTHTKIVCSIFSEQKCTKQLKLEYINLTIPDARRSIRKVGLCTLFIAGGLKNDSATQERVQQFL